LKITTERVEAGCYQTVNTKPIAVMQKQALDWKLSFGEHESNHPKRSDCINVLLELAHHSPDAFRVIPPKAINNVKYKTEECTNEP
jgi:hypothetical protein